MEFAREQVNTYPECVYPVVVRIFQASGENLRVNIGVRWSVCDTNEPPNFIVCTSRNRVVDRDATRTRKEVSGRKNVVLLFPFETFRGENEGYRPTLRSRRFRRNGNQRTRDTDRFDETERDISAIKDQLAATCPDLPIVL